MLSSRPAIECAENIALLSLLTSAPKSATANSSHQIECASDASGRRLSLAEERQLTRTLAFLSGTSGDPDHVTAVAVEEDVTSRQLKVILAINKSNRLAATSRMEQIRGGLQLLLDALGKVTTNKHEQPRSEDEVFNIVIDLCETRVLRRLRSGKTKAAFRNRDKPFLAVHLQRVINALGSRGFACPEGISLQQVLSRTKSFVKLLEDFEAGRCKSLARVMKGLGRFHESAKLDTILPAISNKFMDPGSKEYLCDQIPKLVRYQEAATYLSTLARVTGIFKRSKVVPVCLDDQFFQRETIPSSGPSLSRCFSRARSGQDNLTLPKACAKLQISSEAAAQSAFSSKAEEILRESRIHAEIQIVAFYNLNQVPNPPRFVFSNKDACYLCSTFLRLHGGFRPPKTHGRLYPGWRLPRGLFPPSLELMFNGMLEADIRHNLTRLIQSPKKPGIVYPNESTLSILLVPATPSATSLSTSRSVERVASESNNTSPSSGEEEPAENARPEVKCMVAEESTRVLQTAPVSLVTIPEEEPSELAVAGENLGGVTQAELMPVASQDGSVTNVSPKEDVDVEDVDVEGVDVKDADVEDADVEDADVEDADVETRKIEAEDGGELPIQLSMKDNPVNEGDSPATKETPSHALSVLDKTTHTIRLSTETLELFIEFESSQSGDRPRSVPDVNLDWLRGEELMRALTEAGSSSFNTKDLPVGVDVDTGSPDMFHLRMGQEVLRVNISRE